MAVVWIVPTRPLISKSSSTCFNPLVTVPRALITIGINLTFMAPSLFNSLVRMKYLFFFPLSFNFTPWSAGTAMSTILYYYYNYYSFRAFHISVSWWFLTGVWVTASLLRSPELVSGFWPFSAMLSFGYSLPVRQLPSPLGLLIIL